MRELDYGLECPKFGDFQPTAFDARGVGSDDDDRDWRVAPVILTRDSGALNESNFESAQKILDDAGAEYRVHRFGHWGPGCFEIIVARPDDVSMTALGSIVCALAHYPVLDDGDYSDREHEAALESWDCYARDSWARSLRKLHALGEDAYYLLRDWPGSPYEAPGVEPEIGDEHWRIDVSDVARGEVATLLRQCRSGEVA